ncbi:MAG: hypothetical protein R2991_13800, partial [Thermoanaerobaculia bacterium]
VDAALRRDPELAAERAALAEVAARTRALPRDLVPQRDLWPSIRERTVAAERREGARRWLAAAALAALLPGLAFLAGRWTATRRGAELPAAELPAAPAPGPTPTSRPASAAGPSAVDGARDSLARASLEVRRALEEHRDNLPSETRALVERNLATIEAAIGEIETALEQSPGDPELERLLVAYRERELGLLERVTRAATRL